METNVYSLYDSAAKIFMTPMFVLNDGIAIRSIMDLVNSTEENNIKNHPDQFTLFKIGQYDDTTGQIQPLATPEPKALAIELIVDDKPRYSNVDMEKVLAKLELYKDEVTKKVTELEQYRLQAEIEK